MPASWHYFRKLSLRQINVLILTSLLLSPAVVVFNALSMVAHMRLS